MADVIATLSAALNTISYLVREIDFIRASTFLLDVPKAEVVSLVDGLMVLVSLQFERVKCDYKDFGVMRALLLHTVFLQAQNVISRIRKHVIARPDDIGQACTLKDSYTTSFNMIAVAVSCLSTVSINRTLG